MSRGPFQLYWALAAFLMAPLAFAPPAQAYDQGQQLQRPYPSRGTYISDPPRQFCSEAERAAYVAAAEKALAIVEADADRARAYFIALRQAIAALAPKDAAGRQHLLGLTREFEHGDAAAVTGDGPLHYMTITAPAEIEAKVAAAKAAPVIDCSTLEAVAARRPQLDGIELPALPTRLCSEEEREALRHRLTAAAEAAKEQIEQTTRYLTELGGHDGLGWPGPDTPEHVLYRANLRVERNWALDRNLANSRIQYQAEKRAEALAAMPIVACDTPPAVGAIPAKQPWQVPPRPPLPAGPAPVPATPPCTQSDLAARIELIDAAIRAADTRLGVANAHLVALGGLSAGATNAKADFFVVQQINEEARSYQSVVNALKAAADALRALRSETLARPLAPCPPDAPGQGVVPGTPAGPRAPDKPATPPRKPGKKPPKV
jgi:hypothetical protein